MFKSRFRFFTVILLTIYSLHCFSAGTLGNRFYIKNFLMEKFGSHLEKMLNRNIIANARVFNGPCDIYGQVMTTNKENMVIHQDKEAKCYGDLSDSKISLNGSESSLRKTWMMKTCLMISNDKKAREKIKNKENFINNYFNYETDSQLFIKRNKVEDMEEKELIFKLCTSQEWQYI